MTTRDTTPEHFARVREIYLGAAKLRSTEQDAYIDEAAAGDTALADEVRELLALGDADEGPVNEAIAGVAGRAAETMAAEADVDAVGPYRILETIGHGGMGRVFLAERADGHFDQKVAVKLVDRNRLTRELVERFRSERQILASLEHPNIARLTDGGETDDGVPYLVMEYVDGLPIDRYCDEHQLNILERLELFRRVCAAVEYAHRNLVVHRDLKPSNILVTGDGDPKLLDFGIAKLLSRESIDYTMAVTRGDLRLMTPRNASPEQVRGDTITTATDIYALGLLLYELLTGRFPYETDNNASYPLEKQICETEPTRPSAAVTQLQSDADSAQTINSARRVPSAEQLGRQLKGDLDNIVLVAMRKEPERRYAAVSQLAEDVGNFLEHRPIRARGDSFRYRAAKFLRRNRGGVALATGSLVVVAALITTYTYRLGVERDRAELEADKALEVAGFMTNLFKEADPRQSGGNPISVVGMLDRGADRAQRELGDQPDLQASLMATIGESYHNMWQLKKAREHLEAWLPRLEAELGEDHPDVMRMRYILGMSTAFLGDNEEALVLHEQNYELLVERFGRRSVEAATELHQVGFIQSSMSDFDAAEATFLKVIDIFRGLGDAGRQGLSTALMEYGTLLMRTGRLDENAAAQQEALDLRRALHGERHPDYITALNNVANSYMALGDYEEAAEYMRENMRLSREVLGETSIPYGVAMMNYAAVQSSLGNYEEAMSVYDSAIPIYREGYGEDHPRYAYVQENMGGTLQEMARFDEAETRFIAAMDILATKFGDEHLEVAITRSRYGALLNELERYEEAAGQLERVVATMSAEFGETHNRTTFARQQLGKALHGMGRTDEAIEVVRVGVDALTPSPEHLRGNRVSLLTDMALMYTAAGEPGLALEASEDALATWEDMGPLDNPQQVFAETMHADVLVAQGERETAAERLRSRYDEFVAAFGEDDRNTRRLAEALEEILP